MVLTMYRRNPSAVTRISMGIALLEDANLFDRPHRIARQIGIPAPESAKIMRADQILSTLAHCVDVQRRDDMPGVVPENGRGGFPVEDDILVGLPPGAVLGMKIGFHFLHPLHDDILPANGRSVRAEVPRAEWMSPDEN